MILVLGATGIAGSQVVRALLKQNEEVRVFVRDAEKARALFGDAVEIAVGDFADAQSVQCALEGAEAVFLSGADDPRRVEWEIAAIDAAVAQGVRRIVKLSSITTGPGSPVAFWDWHGRIEEHLRTAPRRGRRPALELLHVERARGRRAGGPRGPLLRAGGRGSDRDDRPARRRRRRGGRADDAGDVHGGRTSSPARRRSPTRRWRPQLSAATGRDVEFVDVPDERARHAMVEAWRAGLRRRPDRRDLRAGAAGRQRRGRPATVESLTGRAPRSFARVRTRPRGPVRPGRRSGWQADDRRSQQGARSAASSRT